MQTTPITALSLDGREFFVKRDELYEVYLAGNKYRKLHKLIQTPKEKLHTLISYGGTQSNAMLALAALAVKKEWKFIYYTKPLSKMQKNAQGGNFAIALELGMQHKEIEESLYRDFVASLALTKDEDGVFLVHQGGADVMAKEGLAVLAQEIRAQRTTDSSLDFTAVATPSGTGTTALFLAQMLPELRVYTTACVGDKEYLLEQMQAVGKVPQNLTILEGSQKYHFAKPYREFYFLQQKLLRKGVEFDLLYAPKMWKMLLEQTEEKVLYIHSGGVSGNISMQERYVRKFADITL